MAATLGDCMYMKVYVYVYLAYMYMYNSHTCIYVLASKHNYTHTQMYLTHEQEESGAESGVYVTMISLFVYWSAHRYIPSLHSLSEPPLSARRTTHAQKQSLVFDGGNMKAEQMEAKC